MNKKMVGQVTEFEKDEILRLFERKNGLKELFQTIDSGNESLYNKIVEDMGATAVEFQKWWDEKAAKYEWENVQGASWEIDFNTCAIYLVQNRPPISSA